MVQWLDRMWGFRDDLNLVSTPVDPALGQQATSHTEDFLDATRMYCTLALGRMVQRSDHRMHRTHDGEIHPTSSVGNQANHPSPARGLPVDRSSSMY